MHHKYRVLTLESATVPNALAALLLHIRDATGHRPHIYLEWTEGHPAVNFLRFLFFGVGEVAPVTREVLRRAEPDRTTAPRPRELTPRCVAHQLSGGRTFLACAVDTGSNQSSAGSAGLAARVLATLRAAPLSKPGS